MKRDRIPLVVTLGFAAVSTLLFLYFSLSKQADVAYSGELHMEYLPLRENPENTPHHVMAKVTSTAGIKPGGVILRYFTTDDRRPRKVTLRRIRRGNYFGGYIPGFTKLTTIFYQLQATDLSGNSVILKRGTPQKENWYILIFTAPANLWLKMLHLGLIAGSFIFFLYSFYFAQRYLLLGRDFGRCFWSAAAGAGSFFVTSFPIGIFLAHQTFGVGWSGIPMGWDITDNKSVLIFLYYAVIIALAKGHLYKKVKRSNRISDRTFARFSIWGMLFTLVIFILPHGISNAEIASYLREHLPLFIPIIVAALLFLIIRYTRRRTAA
ncbi:hypothetical protein CEE39_05450 [bacterium (candidate division B38) B3_B38]|nr:MAG: hypothetical protein CEE39_05450 [bacterium (candidate division B38) B3_B38]